MKKKLTQSQIKERQEKTKKIKSLLIRSLNIVCYCLSVLFIIMAIAIGAQSCSNKNKSETESAAINPSNRIHQRLQNDIDFSVYSFVYQFKYHESSELELTYESMSDLFNHYGYTQEITGSQPSGKVIDEYIDGLAVYDSDFYPVNKIRLTLTYKLLSANLYIGCFNEFILFFDSGSVRGIFVPITFGTTSATYEVRLQVGQLVFSEEVFDSYLIDYFYDFKNSSPVSFTFNNQINYNATFGGSIDEPFLSNGNTTSIDIGWFYSGGQLWDSIKFVWIDATNSSFKLSDDSIYEVTASGYKYFLYMSYENSITSTSVMVNSRDSLSYTNGNALSYYVNNSSTWTSSNYQTITLLSDTSEINITNLNKYNNTSAGGSITTGGNIGLQNGFTLLGSAFSSILPFLAIQVLPGLSIGLLLFIPLIVIIIVLVFKVVKK